ncbi:hypothetical protein Peur_025644 [Populus x canadensis]
MAIVSSAAANHSLDSAAREMYRLSALSALSIASFKRSIIERSSSSSSDPIKVSRRVNRSRIASMTSAAHVQNRVLKAAAKHESHPSETEVPNPSPESVTPLNEKVDLSEA